MLKVYLLETKKQLNILFGQSHKIMNNFIMLIKQKKTIILFVVVVGLATIIFLIFRNMAPFGKVVYYRFGSKLPGTQESTIFSPGKDNILKIPAQIITTSISKLSLNLLSKEFDTVNATLKYKSGPREVILGVRGNEKDKYFYKPLYQSLIQNLDWKKIEEGDFTLWQKDKKYQTLYDFVNNPAEDEKIASYFIDQDKLLLLKPTEGEVESKVVINTPLRDSHIILVRVDKKPLVLKVAKQDMNVYEGEDKFTIAVLKGQSTLVEKTIKDDGIIDTSRLKAEPQEETIIFEDIEPGIYQVNIVSESEGGDILITKIEINQQKVVFKNYIFILGDKPTTLWTSAREINILTWHEESFQTIKLDDKEELKIDEVHKTFSFDLESLAGKKKKGELYKLESPKNDLIISGEGYFAFSKESFFNPEIIKSEDLKELDNLEDIDYVLTTAKKAKEEGDWLVAEVSFDPKDIKIEDNKLYFSLEVPELSKYGGELEIDYFEIAVKSRGILERNPSARSGQEGDEEKAAGTVKLETKEEKNIFVNMIDRIESFFVNSFNKIFRKEEKSDDSTLKTPLSKDTPTPTPSPTPTQTPTPTSAEINKSISINILNAGAPDGYAQKYADLIKEVGYENVEASNSEEKDFTGAKIQYPLGYEYDAVKIEEILKAEYKNVDKVVDIGSTDITVTIGSI